MLYCFIMCRIKIKFSYLILHVMIVIFLTAIIEAHALVTTTGARGTELAPLFKLSVYI